MPPDLTSPPQAFRLLVEYDGTNYAGWQRQAHSPTVQQTLEEALERLLLHPVRVTAAGRTDTGVHALGQVVRFVSPASHATANALLRGGNRFLPDDIRIIKAEPCSPAFDPRRHATMRWYRYTLVNRPVAPVLDRHRMLHVHEKINWNRVETALGYLRGDHEFKAFRAASCTAVRTRLTMKVAEHIDQHPIHHFDFKCRSFLQNMIRILVGLLLDVGRGKIPPEYFLELFESGQQTIEFRVAPPHGLVLMQVDYPA
ncbi:TPA: tRNA pseudouridine(38-40) synthase TruA [Candidatus Sumerlaeota bacterium]|nr:tRNA pseudouridine(38-40) synthase TruA [Candidatus Sumerlaeota bacterium]